MSADIERPDLIRRAAARLGGQALTADAISGKGDALAPSPVERKAGGDGLSSSQGNDAARGGRVVNLSPTVMAANGIFMPSAGAGFVPTIEEFRLIKRHVLSIVARARATMGSAANRILVTSARPGDGKTFTAINLALSLASEHDRRVLLVDADAQRQSMRRYLGVDADLGWIDLLSNESVMLSDVLLRTNIPNLSVITSGRLSSNMPELISSRAMSQFVAEVTESDPERLVIFDSLPCLVSNEPALFAELVGQVVFVVAADETRRDEVQTSLSLVNSCPTVSLVLNKGASLLSEQFGKYGYGYYKTQQPRSSQG